LTEFTATLKRIYRDARPLLRSATRGHGGSRWGTTDASEGDIFTGVDSARGARLRADEGRGRGRCGNSRRVDECERFRVDVVGYVESKGDAYFFATQIEGPTYASIRDERIAVTKRILADLGYISKQ
jgi:hypothetical protein